MGIPRISRVWGLAAVAALSACSLRTLSCEIPSNHPPPAAVITGEEPAAAAAEQAKRIEIAFLGDSLTAGLGLTSDKSYPSQIEAMFSAEGYSDVEVLNGGVSGDTTAGGLRRVEQLLNPNTRILVVALGGNDALRGLTVAETHDNLQAIIQGARARGLAVLLAGMEAPTNLGEDYRTAFHNVFLQLAEEFKGQITFVPFLLEGVAGNPALNQADGIHPTADGAKIVADQLYPRLRDLVDQVP